MGKIMCYLTQQIVSLYFVLLEQKRYLARETLLQLYLLKYALGQHNANIMETTE